MVCCVITSDTLYKTQGVDLCRIGSARELWEAIILRFTGCCKLARPVPHSQTQDLFLELVGLVTSFTPVSISII